MKSSIGRALISLGLAALLAIPLPAQTKECDRVDNAGTVMKEIMDIPDDIPQSVIDKAYCVVVLPSVLKLAFVFGASYGRGVMTCRSGENFRGPWGAPTMMALEGGSFGLQLGGQATDFVLLLMNERAADSILTSKVKLGGDASAAAGSRRTQRLGGNRRHHARPSSIVFARPRTFRWNLAGRFHTTAGQQRQPGTLRERYQREGRGAQGPSRSARLCQAINRYTQRKIAQKSIRRLASSSQICRRLSNINPVVSAPR